MSIDICQYDLNSVVNKEEFLNIVELKECENVGRSLVARRSLSRGDTVLVEVPLLQYLLEPSCRSSLSPFYSKKLWKALKDIVSSEDLSIQQRQERGNNHEPSCKSDDESRSNDSYDTSDSYNSYDSDNSDNSDDDSNDDDGDEDQRTPTSPFIPGVPAALLAFLQLYPPPARSRITESVHFKRSQPEAFEFFYYPPTDMDHSTIQLISRTASRVTHEIDLFQHLDPQLLCIFVLKIYGNAHNVVLNRKLCQRVSLPTHSKLQHRRQTIYSHRRQQQQEDGVTNHLSSSSSSATYSMELRPSIALMPWGSKFAHDCSPNLLLQYDPPTNTLAFVATRAVSKGSLLTFSYLPEDESLGGLVCGTTASRRAKLQQFKFFHCACERCQARDMCRGADCVDCVKSTNWYLGSTKMWACESCHATSTPSFVSNEKGEDYVERMVAVLAAKLRNGPSSNVVHMMETYLKNLLQGYSNDDEMTKQVAVPEHHWTFGYIHGLLAIYHVDLFPRTFGKGLASRLGLMELGLQEAKIYLVDYLHRRLWKTNPVPAFFAAWHVLAPVIQAVISGTEEKQYILPTKNAKVSPSQVKRDDGDENDTDDSDDPEHSDDSDDEGPILIEPLVVSMPKEWIPPVVDMVDIVLHEWVPVIKEIFDGRPSSHVIEDMILQLQNWSARVNESKALS